jgi:hypothetical protein
MYSSFLVLWQYTCSDSISHVTQVPPTPRYSVLLVAGTAGLADFYLASGCRVFGREIKGLVNFDRM